MEHTDSVSLNPKPPVQAPASLVANLEKRLAAQAEYASPHKPAAELLSARDDQRWEIRCAVLQGLAQRGELALSEILAALRDENMYVRMTALHILGMGSFPAHVAGELLAAALRDPDWQVREIALLSLDKLGQDRTSPVEELADHDPASTVRSTADLVLSHHVLSSAPRQRQVQDTRSVSHMAIEQQPERDLAQSAPAFPKPKRWSRKASLLAAITVLLLLALTAAGFGWWNQRFGDQNLYQSLSQKVIDHGVTIELNGAYADQGRTVLVYTITSSDANQRALVTRFDLSSKTPQKQEAMTGTECDPQGNAYHCYWLQPAFLVSAGTKTLMLTWDVHEIALDTPGSSAKSTLITGRWHFVFTIAFHHENNSNLPNPIHGGELSH